MEVAFFICTIRIGLRYWVVNDVDQDVLFSLEVNDTHPKRSRLDFSDWREIREAIQSGEEVLILPLTGHSNCRFISDEPTP